MLRSILALFICFTLHTISLAQAPSSVSDCQNIIGTLRNLDTDEAIPKAKIALEHKGKIVAKAVTDDKGNYTFKNIEDGLYFIKATRYDYDYAYLDQVEINDCKTQYVDLDFDLGTVVTLEPVMVIGYSNPTYAIDICRNKKTTTYIECNIKPVSKNEDFISTRSLPGPSKKNPQKPIKDLSIYPNPSFGQVNIELTFETLQLQLFDMLGHNLGDIPFQQIEDELVSIDLSQLPAGTYALQLQHEEGTDVQKVVILND